MMNKLIKRIYENRALGQEIEEIYISRKMLTELLELDFLPHDLSMGFFPQIKVMGIPAILHRTLPEGFLIKSATATK